MELGLGGRAAVVGGGSSGLGRASAEALAAEGCRLLIWSRDRERVGTTARELRERHGVEVHPVAADATDPGAAAAVAEAAVQALGEVEILVLNAGGPPPSDPIETTPDGWRAAFQLLAITPIELASRSPTSSTRTPGARRWPPG